MNAQDQDLKDRANKALCNTYGRYPLAVDRAKDCRLYGLDGRPYVDMLAGIAVVNLGHCREELNKVMTEQAARLGHVSNLFYQTKQVELAETLLSTAHPGKVFFCNSGAEANEAAVKLARRYMQINKCRQSYEIITLQNSFHGRTLAMLAATGQSRFKEGFSPLPKGFTTVPWGDLPALEQAVKPKTAAIMLELVQGEGGVRPASPEYAAGIAALCQKKDLLLIIDEVQTGMCRTGHFWAFQHYGLKPDIFSVAKGLANGLPMGCIVATDEVAQGFTPGSHAATFGGGPVIAAVAQKTIEIMLRDKLAERSAQVGSLAIEHFKALQQRCPDKIAEVRGLGLMLGIELKFPGAAVWQALLEEGFILNLAKERVLRLLPPLTIEEDDILAFCRTLEKILIKIKETDPG